MQQLWSLEILKIIFKIPTQYAVGSKPIEVRPQMGVTTSPRVPKSLLLQKNVLSSADIGADFNEQVMNDIIINNRGSNIDPCGNFI